MQIRARATLVVLSLLLTPELGVVRAEDRTLETLDIPFLDFEPQLEDFANMEPAAHVRGKLAKASGFIQRTPHDGQPSTFHTEVYVGYDRKNIYAVFVAFDDEPDKIRAKLAPRDETEPSETRRRRHSPLARRLTG